MLVCFIHCYVFVEWKSERIPAPLGGRHPRLGPTLLFSSCLGKVLSRDLWKGTERYSQPRNPACLHTRFWAPWQLSDGSQPVCLVGFSPRHTQPGSQHTKPCVHLNRQILQEASLGQAETDTNVDRFSKLKYLPAFSSTVLSNSGTRRERRWPLWSGPDVTPGSAVY